MGWVLVKENPIATHCRLLLQTPERKLLQGGFVANIVCDATGQCDDGRCALDRQFCEAKTLIGTAKVLYLLMEICRD